MDRDLSCFTCRQKSQKTKKLGSLFVNLFLLVGLPNVGKSTLTNMLAGATHAEAANYVSPTLILCISGLSHPLARPNKSFGLIFFLSPLPIL